MLKLLTKVGISGVLLLGLSTISAAEPTKFCLNISVITAQGEVAGDVTCRIYQSFTQGRRIARWLCKSSSGSSNGSLLTPESVGFDITRNFAFATYSLNPATPTGEFFWSSMGLAAPATPVDSGELKVFFGDSSPIIDDTSVFVGNGSDFLEVVVNDQSYDYDDCIQN